MSFKQFERDMGPRPTPRHTLDRIDNNLGYFPTNCRWATRKEQAGNRRNTRWLTIEGERYRAADLAEQSGLKTDTIVDRAAEGLSLSGVVSPIKRHFSGAIGLASQIAAQMQRERTHCKRGHEFTSENTRITPEGWRNCRTCHNEKMRRRNQAKRNAP
jgi:hypothetical protein